MHKPFEIGLVMAGAVSAGAYTGEVMDFLIQAQDAWQKTKDAAAPRNKRHEAGTMRIPWPVPNVPNTSYCDLAGGHIRNAILNAASRSEAPAGETLEPALVDEYRKLGRDVPPRLKNIGK